MRVLVVTVVHVPTDARIHHRQIRAIAEAGHEVVYAAPFSSTGTPTDLPWVSAVIDVPRASRRRRLAALRAARRVIRQTPADLILLHDPELLLAVGRRRQVAVVWDVHEDTAAALADRPWIPRWLRALSARVVRAMERWAERHVHLMLAEEGYRQRFARPHPVVRNLPWLPSSPVVPGRDRVIYVGRVSRRRGALELAAVGRGLAPDIVVDIVGPVDPDVRSVLEQASASGAVQLHGPLPNARAMGLFAGALAGLCLLHDEPNYRHSMPTKLLEYAAAGLPAITTPLPEAVRAVDSGLGAVVVPFQDADAVIAAVRALRGDPDQAHRLGRAGRDFAEQSWSWDAHAPAFVVQLERWAANE